MNQLYTELAYTVIAFLIIIGVVVMDIVRGKKQLKVHQKDFKEACKGNYYKEGHSKENTWK